MRAGAGKRPSHRESRTGFASLLGSALCGREKGTQGQKTSPQDRRPARRCPEKRAGHAEPVRDRAKRHSCCRAGRAKGRGLEVLQMGEKGAPGPKDPPHRSTAPRQNELGVRSRYRTEHKAQLLSCRPRQRAQVNADVERKDPRAESPSNCAASAGGRRACPTRDRCPRATEQTGVSPRGGGDAAWRRSRWYTWWCQTVSCRCCKSCWWWRGRRLGGMRTCRS